MDILKCLPKKSASQLFNDLPKGDYTYDLDPATAIFGTGLSEGYEANSARNNPIVDTITRAAMVQPRRQVSMAQDFNHMAGDEGIALDDITAGWNKMVTGGSVMDRLTADPNDPYADNFMREAPAPVDLRAVSAMPQAYNEEDKLNTFLSRVAGQTAQSVTGLYRMGLENTGLGNLMPNALGMLEDLSKRAEKVQDTRTGYDTQTGAAIGEDAMNVGSSIAQMLMTGATPYPLTAMGVMSAGQSYDANRNLGVSPDAAALVAGASGLAEGVVEGAFGIGKGIQGVKGALRNAGQTGLRHAAAGVGRGLTQIAAGEMPSELMTTLVQGIADRAVDPLHQTGGMNQEMWDTARVTAEQAGLLGLLGSGVSTAGRMANRRHQRQVDQQIAQRRALSALDPNNAQLMAQTEQNPLPENRADNPNFIEQVLSELDKIRQQNEQRVQAQARQGTAQSSGLLRGLLKRAQAPNEPVTQTREPVAETSESISEADENVSDNPLDIIIANGGIQREVLTKDFGWTDEEISKLPEGVVSDEGMTLLPTRRALKQAGLDTDVNAILDSASWREVPEMDFAEAENELLSQENAQPQQEPAITTKQEKQGNENAKNAISLPETTEQENAVSVGTPLEFSGDELGGLDVPIKTLKVRAANYARKHFAGKTVTVASDGAQIIIPASGIRKAISGNVSPVSAIVMSKLNSLIENGQHVDSVPDRKNRDTIKAVHYYETPVSINGEGHAIRIVIRESLDGKRYYDHFEVRGNLPSGDAERLTGDAPGQRSFQPAKEGQHYAAESTVTQVPLRSQPRQYLTAKDGSFVAVIDHHNNNPIMTAIGQGGQTKEIAVGKTVSQMVQDGRLVSIPKEDFEAWQKGRGFELSKNGEAKSVPVDEEEKETEQGIALFSRRSERAENTTDVEHGDNAAAADHIGIEEVQRIADDLAREYKNVPELVVVEKASDLPFDAPDDAKGAYRNGRCYLVSRNIDTAEDAKSTFAHEVIGHYGLNGFFGDRLASELDSILVHNKNVQESARKWIKDNLDLIRDVREKTNGKWTDEQFRLWRKRRAIEEALAEMAQRGEKVTGVKKLVYAIQKVLRAIGLGRLADMLEAKTDAEALMALHKAELFVHSGKNVDAATAVDVYAKFSLSAMKSVEANIARGKEAMNRALLDKTSVHRAMFRNGLGWVDFVWGSTGRITDNGRTRGAMGIAHILEARQRKDGFSRSEAVQLLHDIVEVIAKGKEFSRSEIGRSTRVGLETQGHVTWLTKYSGSNAWVVTGYEKTPDGKSAGRATDLPTNAIASRTRNDTGAGVDEDNISQNPDSIAFSRKKTTNPNQKATARKTFDVPDITLGDVFVRSVQDDNYDLKKVIQAIREQGGIVTDKTDAYMSEEEYLGKTKNRLDKFTEGHALPIIEKIRESGVSLDEAGKYILARHVMLDQVNAKLKAINPGSTSERLSGMSNREAREILNRNAGNTALQELGRRMDALARYTRSVMLSGGLITKETHDHWANTYQHYVPLYRDLDGTRRLSAWERLKEADFKLWNVREQGNQEAGRRSRGFEVKGAESQCRMGSDLDVTNAIVNAVAQAEGAIIRAEKAKVALVLLDLAKANPNDSFWRVDTPILKRQTNPETGLVEYVYRDANLKPADNVLVVKESGRERWIVFNEHNKRAMEIAKKFKNLDAAAMNWAVEGIGDLTRWMAGWLTQKNPIFMFFNFQRDLQHAVFNMADTPIAGKEGQLLKNVPLAMKGYWEITRSANKGTVNNTFANYAREFKEAGAETGFIKSFESVNDRITDIEKEIKKMSRGNTDPRTWLAIAGRAVDDYNAIAENGVRLAAYITARENGMTIPRAASLAKNITVNFNKRGTSGRWLNALYMFANANIQGNARMLQALVKSRRARIYAGFMFGIGFVMDMVCSSILGDDDETGKPIWDEISEFDKERNWIVPISTKKYIKIPLPQGLHILPNAGRMLSELIRTGNTKNALESASRIVLMTADTLSPLGSSGSWLQMATPSVFRPLVQMKENKSFTGSQLYRGDAPYSGYNEPAYAKAFRNTPKHWVNASKMLNFATGGDDVTPGKINVPPEALRLAFTSFVAPGVSSQVVDRALDVLIKAGGGDELKLRDLPVISRMVGEMPDERAQERAFYSRLNDWRQTVHQIDEYEKQGRTAEADKAARRLGDGDLELGNKRYDTWNSFDADIRKLNKERRQAEKENDKEWIAEANEKRKQLFAEFGKVL